MSKSSAEDYFVKYGILGPNHSSEAAKVFLKIQPDLFAVKYVNPSKYVNEIWSKIQASDMSANMNGVAFELVLACVLILEDLHPFYMSAEVKFVPNARFDLMFYSHEIGPIVLSAKTSLRERYKQADLESLALRAVYRRSKTFLITLDEREARNVQLKIENGEVTSLERCVVATSQDFDYLIEELHGFEMIQAPLFPVVEKGRIVSK
jgi:hypothetical protein